MQTALRGQMKAAGSPMRNIVIPIVCCAAMASGQVQVKVGEKVITPRFTGVGFHAEFFMTTITPEFFDQVVAKRWKELNPGFARVFTAGRRSLSPRDQAALDGYLKQFLFLKEATGTEVYFTTGGPKDTKPGAERVERRHLLPCVLWR
jgi:hypothetical protein